MYRLGAAIVFSIAAFAQMDLRSAVKSPVALARYIESHETLDWDAFWAAIGRKDPDVDFPPCGGSVRETRCSSSVFSSPRTSEQFLIINAIDFRLRDVYLRYKDETNGGWNFVGEHSVVKGDIEQYHEVTFIGSKPFLKLRSDLVENGAGLRKTIEEWFDLSQPGMKPVFSVTIKGHQTDWGIKVGREVESRCIVESGSPERIQVMADVVFTGMGLDLRTKYVAEYVRLPEQNIFALQRAYSQSAPNISLSAHEFEDLLDTEAGPSPERLLSYAFAGLQKIAAGRNQDAKQWLSLILDSAKNTPEKRALLKILAAKR